MTFRLPGYTDEMNSILSGHLDAIDDFATSKAGKVTSVTAAAVLGAIALPIITGGGIGISMAGSAFGISAPTVSVIGASTGAYVAHEATNI